MTYPTDAQAKAAILEAGRKIYQRGLVAANDGNLSVRVGENALWVTPTGVSKGAMTEEMLVKLDLDGNVLEGTRKPSSETKMHLRIYREDKSFSCKSDNIILSTCPFIISLLSSNIIPPKYNYTIKYSIV